MYSITIIIMTITSYVYVRYSCSAASCSLHPAAVAEDIDQVIALQQKEAAERSLASRASYYNMS